MTHYMNKTICGNLSRVFYTSTRSAVAIVDWIKILFTDKVRFLLRQRIDSFPENLEESLRSTESLAEILGSTENLSESSRLLDSKRLLKQSPSRIISVPFLFFWVFDSFSDIWHGNCEDLEDSDKTHFRRNSFGCSNLLYCFQFQLSISLGWAWGNPGGVELKKVEPRLCLEDIDLVCKNHGFPLRSLQHPGISFKTSQRYLKSYA